MAERLRTTHRVHSAEPMLVTYRRGGGPLDPAVHAEVTEELERVGYLRVFRRVTGTFLHVAEWDVLRVDGVLQ